MAGYAVPEVLVDTAWVEDHKNDPKVRLVEVDVDTAAYDQGHIPGAIAWNWTTQLCDTVRRDIIPKDEFEALMAPLRGRQRHHRRALRRQQQLVRRLGALADEDLRPQGRPADERRPQEVAGRRPRADDRDARLSRRRPTGRASPTCRCAPSCREVHAGAQAATSAAGGRAQPAGVHAARSWPRPACPRPASAAAISPARASIPWGKACNEDGTFKSYDELQGALRRQGHHRRPAGDHLLPHRRALQPYLVRPEVPARLPEREELRRVLDRVGQPRRRAGRARRRCGSLSRAAGRGVPRAARERDGLAGANRLVPAGRPLALRDRQCRPGRPDRQGGRTHPGRGRATRPLEGDPNGSAAPASAKPDGAAVRRTARLRPAAAAPSAGRRRGCTPCPAAWC